MNKISEKVIKGILAAAALSILGSAGTANAKPASQSGDGLNVSTIDEMKVLKRKVTPNVLRLNRDGSGTLLADHYSHSSHMSHYSHSAHFSRSSHYSHSSHYSSGW